MNNDLGERFPFLPGCELFHDFFTKGLSTLGAGFLHGALRLNGKLPEIVTAGDDIQEMLLVICY